MDEIKYVNCAFSIICDFYPSFPVARQATQTQPLAKAGRRSLAAVGNAKTVAFVAWAPILFPRNLRPPLALWPSHTPQTVLHFNLPGLRLRFLSGVVSFSFLWEALPLGSPLQPDYPVFCRFVSNCSDVDDPISLCPFVPLCGAPSSIGRL